MLFVVETVRGLDLAEMCLESVNGLQVECAGQFGHRFRTFGPSSTSIIAGCVGNITVGLVLG